MASGRELLILALGFVLGALPPPALAEPADAALAPAETAPESVFGDFSLEGRDQPIAVRSDKLEFSYRDRLLTYTGDVVVTQGDLTLRADTLQVTIGEEGADRLETITALGAVQVSQGNRTASGGRGVFDQRTRTIELSENAVLTEGPNKITGERVTVYLDEQRSVVDGGERRVQALLFPGEDLEGLAPSGGSERR